MMSSPFNKIQFYELLNKAYDNSLTDVEKQQLNDDIKSHDQAALIFLSFFACVSNLKDDGTVSLRLPISNDITEYDEFLKESAEEENTAETITVSQETEPEKQLIQKVVYLPREKRKISKFSIASLIVSAAAVLFLVLFVKLVPEKHSVEVAMLVDQINVQWDHSDADMETGSRLWTNEGPLGLRKGTVKLRYNNGAEVLIEGPAVFEVERKGLYLEYGRLYSHVTETGLGFTVTTPTSQFIDHGTEFGVLADLDGSSELHVLKGKVQVFAGVKEGPKSGQMVTENKAVRYNRNTDQIKAVPVKTTTFVRQVDSKSRTIWRGGNLNLADIAGGGNGYDDAGTIGAGVDLETGEPTLKSPLRVKEGHRRYLSVHENPFIDGVFVPDGGAGPVKISSAGHVFTECPDTSGSFYWNVANGGQIRTCSMQEQFLSLLMDGVKYGSKENPALILHSNAGITFDLSAIQMQMSEILFSAFQGQCCISEEIPVPQSDTAEDPKVSVFVLVDGQVRFEKNDLSISDGGVDINVPLDKDDRFLSLVVTDSGKTIVRDYCFIANPVLVVE